MSLQFALLRERARPYTAVPRTAETIFALLQVLYMFAFAVILKFLVAPERFGAENTIFAEPLTGEVSLSTHGLVVGQLDLWCGGMGRHGKGCILVQSRAAVAAGEISIMMVQIVSETMAEIVGKSKILPDRRTNIKRDVPIWLLWAEDGADHGLWLG
jgi:hypothetical protein